MHGARREPAFGEVGSDPVGRPLRPGEDHAQSATLGLQRAREHLGLVEVMGAEDELRRRGHHRALVGRLRTHVRRVREVAPRQRDDRARHRRGEQHGLTLGRRECHDPLHVRQEPEVEHLVGLVEHQHLQLREVEHSLAGQVEQPSGRTDDDVDAFAQGLELWLVGPTAVDGQNASAAVGAGHVDVTGHLRRELAGRHDDERLWLAVARRVDLVQDRNGEAHGLAGAGAGLTDQVVVLERERDRQGLDRERVDDLVAGQGIDDVVGDAQVGKGLLQRSPSSCRDRDAVLRWPAPAGTGGRVAVSAAVRVRRRTAPHQGNSLPVGALPAGIVPRNGRVDRSDDR